MIIPHPAPHRSPTKHPRVNVTATQPWITQPRPHPQQQRQHDTAEERALIGAAYFLVHLACVGRRRDPHVLGEMILIRLGERGGRMMWIWVRMKSVGDDLLGGREVPSWSLRILLQAFFRSLWFFISIITLYHMFSLQGIIFK